MRPAIFLLLLAAPVAATHEGAAVNPVRRVVTMLQMMQKKVIAEGEKEQELFEKFMCYCKNGKQSLVDAIKAAEEKIPQLEEELKAFGGEAAQLAQDITEHKKDREEAKAAIEEKTQIRKKEAAAFATLKKDSEADIAATTKAIAALEKGVGSFLQSSTADVLRRIVMSVNMQDGDRDSMTSFLSQGSSEEYAPQSGEIIGILKQMLDTMQADFEAATKAEAKAIAQFKAFIKATKAQIEVLTKQIQEKIKRLGDIGVEVVNKKEEIEDTKKQLEDDKAFLADLEKNCKTKAKEWAARKAVRAQELLALSDTIKILNDDDALELFKKTLPSPSFLQLTETSRQRASRALTALGSVGGNAQLQFISLALHGKKVDFGKVIKMIDDMIVLLGEEQAADDEHKASCEKRFDEAEDEHKVLTKKIADLEAAIASMQEAIKTLTDEIAALTKGIKDLDKQVAEAGEQRKEEHADFVANTAANNAALQLLDIAKNRLNKFYNPALYKPPPKRELTEEERISVNNGGTLAPTAAPGGIAGTGVTVLSQTDPGPAPETFSGEYKKSEGGNGVIAMIDLLKKDLVKEINESKLEENEAAKDYAEFLKDAKKKRADDAKAITDKTAVKSDTEGALEEAQAALKGQQKELADNVKLTAALHGECDWLIEHFDIRKEARTGEIDALKNAKAVLSGADYSFVQIKSH